MQIKSIKYAQIRIRQGDIFASYFNIFFKICIKFGSLLSAFIANCWSALPVDPSDHL